MPKVTKAEEKSNKNKHTVFLTFKIKQKFYIRSVFNSFLYNVTPSLCLLKLNVPEAKEWGGFLIEKCLPDSLCYH